MNGIYPFVFIMKHTITSTIHNNNAKIQHKTKYMHYILVLHLNQRRVDGEAEPNILKITIIYSQKRR